jgi:hypothetical protein
MISDKKPADNPLFKLPRNPSCFSTSNQLFGCKSIGSLPTADENAYDVVPEYISEFLL